MRADLANLVSEGRSMAMKLGEVSVERPRIGLLANQTGAVESDMLTVACQCQICVILFCSLLCHRVQNVPTLSQTFCNGDEYVFQHKMKYIQCNILHREERRFQC